MKSTDVTAMSVPAGAEEVEETEETEETEEVKPVKKTAAKTGK